MADQHLLNEDRQDYERLLDEALRSAPHRPELAAVGQRLNIEQLRTMALNATTLVTAAAATEYQHYVTVRDELRQPASSTRSSTRSSTPPSTPSSGGESGSGEPDVTGAMGLATTPGEAAETTGAGAVAVVAVLAPVLAGTATAIFLIIGYILKALDPEPAFTQTMLAAGWVFGAVTAASIVVAAVGLLLTALRDSSSLDAGAYGEANGEVARAREAWREALLERGILPFLERALANPATASGLRRTPTPAPHPRWSNPDCTNPEFGGPEHQPE
ncbi:hypothetical protein AB0I54_21530 [Streptomyces sp. NPDC050625]|uniref:hypothetical protein n=1 Tax=Streptomyces sp. NPDC050625 TaxID=3154629 RepID=UPI00341EA7FC